ncbi:hypothetical protein EV177_000971 [Coemansia sp. RSA 1804]|nr:hypothetical protein EV177_000971 [Coemansia sp. RSA 1804]
MRMNTMYIIFAAILAISVAVAAENKLQDGDEDIKGLLGMRPDLADELDPVDEDGNRIPQDKSSESGPIPQAESNAAIKKQNEEVGCINECKDTDQSCRARCLGVPGVASRKLPRKQDINGNLPLNWRTHSSSCTHSFSIHYFTTICSMLVVVVVAWLV